jgi:hypothetical protein
VSLPSVANNGLVMGCERNEVLRFRRRQRHYLPLQEGIRAFQLDAPFIVLNTGEQVSTGLIPECKDSSVLRTRVVPSLHDGVWWAKATAQFNFRRPDALDAGAFNRLLWRGIKGEGKPYPGRSGALRHDDDDDTPDVAKGAGALK